MKAFAMLIWLGLAGAAGFALFHITFKVEQLEAQLSSLNVQILEEQRNVHVLRAEWSHLNSPQRLQQLADELLPHLSAAQVTQVADVNSLPLRQSEDPTTAVPAPAALKPIPASAKR